MMSLRKKISVAAVAVLSLAGAVAVAADAPKAAEPAALPEFRFVRQPVEPPKSAQQELPKGAPEDRPSVQSVPKVKDLDSLPPAEKLQKLPGDIYTRYVGRWVGELVATSLTGTELTRIPVEQRYWVDYVDDTREILVGLAVYLSNGNLAKSYSATFIHNGTLYTQVDKEGLLTYYRGIVKKDSVVWVLDSNVNALDQQIEEFITEGPEGRVLHTKGYERVTGPDGAILVVVQSDLVQKPEERVVPKTPEAPKLPTPRPAYTPSPAITVKPTDPKAAPAASPAKAEAARQPEKAESPAAPAKETEKAPPQEPETPAPAAAPEAEELPY